MAYPSASARAYALSVVIHFVRFFICTRIQVLAKFDNKARAPEDAMFGPILGRGRHRQNFGIENQPKDPKKERARENQERWDRIIMNEVESVPLALFVFGAAVLLDCDESRLVACIAVFTLMRCAFPVCYALSLQPHRSIVYFIGFGTVCVCAGDIIVKLV